MEHSNGMLHLYNFNEDFAFALDIVNSECAGVYQVKPTSDAHHLSVSLSSLVELINYCEKLLYAHVTSHASNQ
jgi:hypothetical protein